jgi:hypothetical protein
MKNAVGWFVVLLLLVIAGDFVAVFAFDKDAKSVLWNLYIIVPLLVAAILAWSFLFVTGKRK